MLQTQRDRAILDHLTRQGSARIEDLAQKLSVSEETVRRAAPYPPQAKPFGVEVEIAFRLS